LARRFIRDCACFALLALALKRSMNFLQVFAFGLFFLEGDLLQAQMLGPLPLKGGVVARIQLGPLLVQMQGVGTDAVEELAIVRDHQQRAGILEQPLLEPQHRIQVQMVGGLVEQQQIGRRHQRPCHVQPHPPAAGKLGNRLHVRGRREAQAMQQSPGACCGVVAVHFFQPLMGQRHRFIILGRHRCGFGADGRPHFRIAGDDKIDGRIRQRGGFLRHAGDADPAGNIDVALVRLQLTLDRRKQAALAAAIATDHADAATRVQGQIDTGQQQVLATPQGKVSEGNHEGADYSRGVCGFLAESPAASGERCASGAALQAGSSARHQSAMARPVAALTK
jgi:hypothetical protein